MTLWNEQLTWNEEKLHKNEMKKNEITQSLKNATQKNVKIRITIKVHIRDRSNYGNHFK